MRRIYASRMGNPVLCLNSEGMRNMKDQEKQEGCTLCPRSCHAAREGQRLGQCGVPQEIRVARAALHMWEEPCISGGEGSGTVFFSGCALGCVYCQNREISGGKAGKFVSVERLSDIFLELQEKKANNINLVTPGHYAPQIADALKGAKKRGLRIPVVYNTGSYERLETLRIMEGLVDIYLPDFKYMDAKISARYSNAPNYAGYAKLALKEMVRQAKAPVFDERGMMTRGVLVRHLALPGCAGDSRRILKYLHDTYGGRIYISIMNQYTPMPGIEEQYPELARRLTEEEYEALVDYAISIGIENGFIQEGETARESFIPPFDLEGV